jgi:two-component system response regulator VicR
MALPTPTPNRSQSPHVLVVDDDKPVTDLFKKELEKIGYTVDTAANGAEGLEKAQQFKPKLIILDMIMPKISGREFLEKLRGFKGTFAIPVMIVSHLESAYEQKKCEELGIECFLVKHQHSVADIIGQAKAILTSR